MKVHYSKAKSKQEAYELACEQITDEYVAKFNVNANISYDPHAGKIEAKGPGFTLTLVFDQQECQVNLDLTFLLRPLKGKVLNAVEKKLKYTV